MMTTHKQVGDVLGVFDSNQIMQRRWQITLNNVVKSSVITMVMFFHIYPNGVLQEREDLKPFNWSLKVKYIDQNPAIVKTKFEHQHEWLDGIIMQVASEQRISEEGNQNFVDEVDLVKENVWMKKYKRCQQCHFREVPRRARLCPNCHLPYISQPVSQADQLSEQPTRKSHKAPKEMRVVFLPSEDTEYTVKYEPADTAENANSQPTTFCLGHHIFVNPCSILALATVFRNIGKQAGIKPYGGSREWITIVCDGLPYVPTSVLYTTRP